MNRTVFYYVFISLLMHTLFAQTPGSILSHFPKEPHNLKPSFDLPKMPTPPKEHYNTITELPEPEETQDPDITPPEKAPIKTHEEQELLKEAKKIEEEEQKITFYFEDATLENITKYIESLFDVTFLSDDAVQPLMTGGVPLSGNRVSFKTNRPLTRKDAWNIYLRLLDLAGLTLIPGATPNLYRITSVANANQLPLPIYFNTDLDKLPNNSQKIRYVYFIKNNSLATVQNVATSLASVNAKIMTFQDLNAIIITDKGSNIVSLMQVIQEFDKTIPEAMSVLKLKRTDASKVATLYGSLTQAQTPQGSARFAQQKNQPGSLYFPVDARIIPEVRTNSLIILGPKQAVEKIEHFIIKHVDTELDMPYSPLHVYQLQNTNANNISSILQNVIQFGSNTTAGQTGGVRDGQKYFKSSVISITPEPTGNRLIITAEEDDYQKLVEIIKTLDIAQPQVAIEVLIIDVSSTNAKQLNVQLRNKTDGSIINNVNMQSAQIGGDQSANPPGNVAVDNNGGLLGNLIGLATGTGNPVGTTLLSIGSAATNGIWGLFRILKTYTDAKIVSNPFLLATNNYQAVASFGETRRVITATVGSSTQSFGDKDANLNLTVTPQINTDGIITMNINLQISEFSNAADPTSAATTTKNIQTTVHIKNQEVLVLGGITKNTVTNTVTGVPVLEKIPLVGSLFRGKSKNYIRSNLLVMLSPRIVMPTMDNKHVDYYTNQKANDVRDTLDIMHQASVSKDPVDRLFFESSYKKADADYLDNFNDFMAENQNGHTQQNHETMKRMVQSFEEPKSKRKRLARRRAA